MTTEVVELQIAADHPTFSGHFPGNPVLPGVVLLSLVIEAVLARPALAALLGATPQIDQVKWLAPVGPGQALRLELTPRGAGIDFVVLGAGLLNVAKGRLSCPP